MPEGRHRSTSRVVIIGVGVAVVAAIGVLAVALGRGATEVRRSTPAFSFSIARAIGTSVAAGVKDRDLEDRAAEVADEVAPMLDLLYAEAFLDPENLDNGTYEPVWELFDDGARATATEYATTLTLGALGSRFADVEPDRGVLSARVLFDADGEAKLVSVRVTFRAIATPSDETATVATIVSRGEYLLERRETGWVIVAFRIDREDDNLPSAEGTS